MGMLRFNYEPGSEIGQYALKILLRDGGLGLRASVYLKLQNALEAKKSRIEVLKALDYMDKLGTEENSYMLNMKMPPSVRMKFKKSESLSASGTAGSAGKNSSLPSGGSGSTVWGSFGGLSGKPAPVTPPSGGKAASSRAEKLSLWDMGSFIGAAALLNQSPDVPLSKATQFYGWAEDVAQKFQLHVSPMPPRTGSPTKDTMASLTWATQGQYPLWNGLESKYGETERLDLLYTTLVQTRARRI